MLNRKRLQQDVERSQHAHLIPQTHMIRHLLVRQRQHLHLSKRMIISPYQAQSQTARALAFGSYTYSICRPYTKFISRAQSVVSDYIPQQSSSLKRSIPQETESADKVVWSLRVQQLTDRRDRILREQKLAKLEKEVRQLEQAKARELNVQEEASPSSEGELADTQWDQPSALPQPVAQVEGIGGEGLFGRLRRRIWG